MSRILFIRVSAETYDERDVLESWPKLFAAVWPDASVDKTDSPSKIVNRLLPDPKRGALELLDGFVEYARFGDMSDAPRKAAQPHAEKLSDLRLKLDAALGDRDVSKAHALTNDIEDTLDEAEKAMRESA
jgi:hypothetical protein